MEILQDSLQIAASTLAEVAETSTAAALPVTEAAGPTALDAIFTANNVWMLLCTGLVFIMHLGFAGVEAGFTQSKNTVNILFKNTLTPILGLLTYCVAGFSLMYPASWGIDGVFGEFGAFGSASLFDLDVLLDGMDNTADYASAGYTEFTDFLFQAMFAATAATIVSGAVAERIKISAYLAFTLIFVGLVYPILGSWHWGTGWLYELGFYDFAGSTLVHSVGGWGALAGIIVLGPRLGKYVDGKVIDKPGSSVPLAVVGVFLLFWGWFGFNGGSVLSADPTLISLVLVTTTLGACGGGLAGWVTGFIVFRRLDLGMVLNGVLAGLVGITASADHITPFEAIIIGAVAGVLVVLSAITLDKFKLDDCVGAVSVHLTCGIWGTLATGIFAGGTASLAEGTTISLGTQALGVAAYGAVAFSSALIIFLVLKYTIGIRVSKAHEEEGLDSHEHGIRGYTIVYDA